MKKILVLTDMDSTGSGYKNVCTPLLAELSKLGYEIKIAGLMYRGEEHNYPFSIIPAQNVQEMMGIASNLIAMWWPDIVLVAMDIPIQINLYNQIAPALKRSPQEIEMGEKIDRKYIAITPLENGPLTISWAIPLMNLDKVFFISELGKQEAIKAGVSRAEHLQIGVDTVSFHPATPKEKVKLRDGMGIPQDAFVVLTVADNQERKNLWAGLKAISHLKKEIERPIRYILVTREQNPYGYKMRDLVKDLDIQQEYICFERGIPQKDLWGLYALSDVYLQPSKAEGLGLPVLDAMACGIPVVATNTGALTELLENGRGFLVDGYEFDNEKFFVDVWGNSRRVMINIKNAKDTLLNMSQTDPKTRGDINAIRNHAYDYVLTRTWDIPAKQVDDAIKELLDEQK